MRQNANQKTVQSRNQESLFCDKFGSSKYVETWGQSSSDIAHGSSMNFLK